LGAAAELAKLPQSKEAKTVTAALPTLLLSALYISSQALFGQAKSEAQLHAERGLQLMQAGDLPAAELELRQAVKLSPRDPTHLAELGVVLGMEQKLADSDRYFQEALGFDPDNVAIRRNLAKNQWRLGEFESAEVNLQKILKAQPGDEGSTLILGMVEENLQHFASAARLLNSVPALVTQHPEAVAALARSYYQIKNSSSARQTLRSLLQDNVPSEALYLGGQTALEAEDFNTAEELFAAAKPGYADRSKLGYFLAFSRYRGGKFRDCQDTVLDTLAAGPPTRDLYTLLGWCYAQQDKIRESTEAFDQAVALDPANETTYLDLGTVLLDHRQDELALALGKETATKFPSSYRSLMLRGTAEANLGYLTDAVKSFGRAVELNPNSPEANYDLAIIQSIAGFANDALGTLQRGIKKFPRDAPHYQEYASLEIQQAEGGDAGAEARAYEALHKALSLDNSLAQAHLLLGKLELKNNRVEQAVSELETAAKLDPHDAAIHLALSRAYARLGVPDKAAKELATYKNFAQAELQGGRGRTPVALRPW
jgi:Flp pilus assembly protein TadD